MHWSAHVRSLMTPDPICIQVDAPPSELAALLADRSFHHLPVVDGETLVGIVSTIDLARVSLENWVTDAATRAAWLDEKFQIRDLMTWEPAYIEADATVRAAAQALGDGGFHALPVLEDGKLVGIVTSTDLLRFLAAG